VAKRATFAAEIAGCQVETGVAGAMAPAAVVEAAGGKPRQAADTASGAFTCADLILGGYANPIPLDESIDAAFEVGKALPRELRCTARGGRGSRLPS